MTISINANALVIRSKPGCAFSEPTPEWCPPLKDNLGPGDGEPRPGHFGTPERFFHWLQEIWKYKVDAAKSFAPSVFTRNVLLTDSFATVCGAVHGSIYFQLVFAFFPDLSGPHFSYAATDNTIFTNWGFFTTKGRQEILVPSIDIFGLKKGFVNYRLSVFDVATLIRTLLMAYAGQNDPLFEGNLQERMWRWHTDEEFAKKELAAVKAAKALA